MKLLSEIFVPKNVLNCWKWFRLLYSFLTISEYFYKNLDSM